VLHCDNPGQRGHGQILPERFDRFEEVRLLRPFPVRQEFLRAAPPPTR
jgi:hypothetical protein